ncbi:hypothetical protein ACN38_g6420 [Penicillium nordicum]|uniref:Uncharacterized protein n=1 Tax=Penicillium nordicum TaxID=229535 RepID=A0A0M8P742_9EURO|nr:hypothetical protein ACN38_g6420 [Penicillium nordicum]
MPAMITGRTLLRKPLPPLDVGPYHTTSSALHEGRFLGTLHNWPNFFQDVKQFENNQDWSPRLLGWSLQNRMVDAEFVAMGDEHGIQGRFQQSVGQVVGSVLNAQNIAVKFGDFRSADIASVYPGYTLMPDVALISTDPVDINQIKAVGELKSPWVNEHKFKKYSTAQRKAKLFAQPIGYMLDLQLRYGFMSNYDDTVFLRQVFKNGEWVVEYSPVVEASFDGSDTMGNEPPSLRQCFAYLSSLASVQPFVDNSTPRDNWIG